MQMKFIILAILAGSLIAVSPSAVGQHYDDTLHNNLSIAMRSSETDATQVSTNPVIVPLARKTIVNLAKENMNQEDFAKMSGVVNQVVNMAKMGDSHTTFHAFIAALTTESEVRTYELTVVRNENTLVGILNKKTHVIDTEVPSTQYYNEIYTSEFGLQFVSVSKSSIEKTEFSEDMVSYMREYLLRSAEQSRKTSMHSEHQLQSFVAWAAAASEAVKSLTEAAKGIIEVFKTVKTNTLKEHVKGEGFKAYSANSSYSRILGVPTSKYDRFIKAFMIQTGFYKAPKSKEMDAYFEIASFASNEWKLNDFVFGTGSKSNICNNMVITNQINYVDNVVHFVAVNVKGTFELADDTLIYTQYKSIIGGLSETTKDVRKKVPRDITNDEIKAINALMVLNAINVYSDNMNIKFSLPANDPWKM